MEINLFDLNGTEIGRATVADADGSPEFVQLDDGSGRTFRRVHYLIPDYAEISPSQVTLIPTH